MAEQNSGDATAITSIKQLQDVVPALLRRINADPQLALAAAINPLLALEDMGYEVAPAVRLEIEERSRFSKKQIARRGRLRSTIFKAVGKPFDLSSPAELRRILAEDLGLGKRGWIVSDTTLPSARLQAHEVKAKRNEPEDPLKSLEGAHPVIEALLEYRKLDASTARFASREVYDRVRSGQIKLPVANLKASVTKKPLKASLTRVPRHA